MEAVATSSLLVSFSGPRRSPASFIRCPAAASSARPPLPCTTTSSSYSVVSGAKQQPVFHLAVCSSRIQSVRCSSAATGTVSTVVSTEKWLLEPAGDGDWKHIGYRVARPGAIEIISPEAVTIGRVPEKADIVLPVATVSGVHARLEKKDGSLLVTDMDSTNGTYINEKKLTPGFGVPVDPGSLLIFGDTHLAMFRVKKMIVDVPIEAGEDEQEAKAEVSTATTQETS